MEAEILFLRRQLALYRERGVKPRRMNAAGQERIANELLVKLGLRVSPRTVAKCMRRPAPGRPRGGQRWSTFLRNHARGVMACDFLVSVTSTFRVLYVLVVIEHHSRRLIHFNVTAQWTRQQLREAVGYASLA